jgi:putative spermidine/putrescine transport system permease protein
VPRHWLLVGLPAVYLLVFFAVPNAVLLSVSFLKTEAQVLTNELTLGNYVEFFTEPLYVSILWRTLWIGVVVGLLVVILAYPLAYFLTRTTSRWQGLLIALCLSPLLASVVVRTYGWFVILHRRGVVNESLMALGIIDEPLRLLPSSLAIVIGLTHVLMPYGVLTIMSSLQGINPSLERAAMNLGASRTQTFFRVLLPLSLPGLAGGFLLAFAITISSYATPAILGGPRSEVMATQVFNFMVTVLDWSLGSTFGAILIITSCTLLFLAARVGSRRSAL